MAGRFSLMRYLVCLLAGLGMVFALACGGSPEYCDAVAAVIAPESAYAEAVIPAGTFATLQPVTTRNGPIVASTLTSGSLPPGLALQPNGSITGTPTTAGVYTTTLSLCNAQSACTSATLKITVVPANPLSLSYATPLTFPINWIIAPQAPTLANATPGLVTTYVVTVGSLPPGLTIDPATGLISGTPTAFGAYAFTVSATNGTRTATGDALYTITPLGAMTASYPTPQTFTQGAVIGPQPCTVTNGTPGVTGSFALASGALPPGLTLNADGTITGTPTTVGVYLFTVTATSALRSATTNPVTYIVVPSSPMTASYGTPRTFTQGSAITPQPCALTNDTPGATPTFALASGTLPPGLALNADGTITGTPTAIGISTFTVTVTSAARTATTPPVVYTVASSTPMAASYATPQTFTEGTAIASQVGTLTNGTPGVTPTFFVASGVLPPGLTLNPDGTITGTPTTPGLFTFTVLVTSGARSAQSNLVTYTVISSSPMTVSYPTPLTVTQGTPIPTQASTITNGVPGVTPSFTVNGSLPPGLTLNADGTITGTPTTPGLFAFTVTASYTARSALSNTLVYTVVSSSPMVLTYASPQTFTQGTPITSQSRTITNGTPGATPTFVLASGTLPPGLTLNADGTITGTPTTPGVFSFAVEATSGLRSATSSSVVYTVVPAAAMTASYATPQIFAQGLAIAPQSCAVANDTPGVTATFSLASGALPTGLTLNPDGTITGTPSLPGVFTFRVKADSAARTATTPLITYTVGPLPVIGTQPVSQVACVGASTAVTVAATNATSYQWSFNGAPLADGAGISGVTTATLTIASTSAGHAGSYTCTVTNAVGSTVSSAARLEVGSAITTQPSSQTASALQTATFAVAVTGKGPFTYQWSKNSVSLGPGGQGSAYTTAPLVVGDNGSTFSVQITDACGTLLTSSTATLTVNGNNVPPVIVIQPLGQIVTSGSTPTFTVTASGTAALSYQWYVIPYGSTAAGTLVAGATGASYTLPTTATQLANDNDQYYVMVENAYGQAVSIQAPLVIDNGILLQLVNQPQTAFVDPGAPAQFGVTVTTSGSAPTYQWYRAEPGSSTFTAIPGATSAAYALPAAALSDTGAVYYCVASNNAPHSVTSQTAALFVGGAGTIGSFCSGWATNSSTAGLPIAISTPSCGYTLVDSRTYLSTNIFWPQLVSTANLSIAFTLDISTIDLNPGDGFCLVLGDPSLGATTSQLGFVGQGIGAMNIPGLVLAFDTNHNTQTANFHGYFFPADPAIPYVAVGRGEPNLFAQPWKYLVGLNPMFGWTQTTFTSATHDYLITLHGGWLTLSIDGQQVFTGPVSVPPVAYLGFTASTGASFETCKIYNFTATVAKP